MPSTRDLLDDEVVELHVEPGAELLQNGLPVDVGERLRDLAEEVQATARSRVAIYHPDVADTMEVTELPDGSVEVSYQASFAPEIEERWGYLTSALTDVAGWERSG